MTNEQRIWEFLIGKGLTPAGVAGLMGNLYAESGFNPKNLQGSYERKLGMTDESYTAAVDNGSYSNFTRDCAGYGLAQWTYWSRKAALLSYAKAAGRSVGDLETQLGFLIKEISGYKSVYAVLTTTDSVKAASDIVLTSYERPADQSDTAKNRRAGYSQTFYDRYVKPVDNTPVKEDEQEGKNMFGNIKTGTQLAQAAIYVAKNFKTLYVNGCFGAPMTDKNKKRYTQNTDYNKQPARTAKINAASADTFGFDCVCFIKGLLWGWCGDKNHVYGGATYKSNGVPDIGADSMIKVCKDVSTDFSKIAVGEAVWMEGHIGIYVGNGLAVECTPKWSDKVQITACNQSISGYNRRNWTKHGKLPYISYTTGEKPADPAPQKKTIDELALEVIDGKWGNGTARKEALTAAGYDYRAVQDRVNEIIKEKEAAKETATPKEDTKMTETIYTVVKGDTLSGIARKYGTTYQKLAEYNGIANPNIIHVGQKIRIPGTVAEKPVEQPKYTVYTVVKGDTLSGIAKKYGTTYQKLAEYNGIANPNIIHVGQQIKIPQS